MADLVVAHEVLGHHLAVGPWIESSAYLARALSAQGLSVRNGPDGLLLSGR